MTAANKGLLDGVKRIAAKFRAVTVDGGLLAASGPVRLSAVRVVTANYAISVISDYMVLVSATLANVTVTLPDATLCQGQVFVVKRTDSTGNTVTLAAYGSQVFDGVTSATLVQYSSLILVSDGSNWQVQGADTQFQNINVLGAAYIGNLEVYSGLNMNGTVAVLSGGTDTSGTAVASTPTFSTTVAKQLSTVQDVMLYMAVKSAVSQTFALSFGATSAASTTLFSSATVTPALGTMLTLRVPKGWYVKFTGTVADWTFVQVTC